MMDAYLMALLSECERAALRNKGVASAELTARLMDWSEWEMPVSLPTRRYLPSYTRQRERAVKIGALTIAVIRETQLSSGVCQYFFYHMGATYPRSKHDSYQQAFDELNKLLDSQ